MKNWTYLDVNVSVMDGVSQWNTTEENVSDVQSSPHQSHQHPPLFWVRDFSFLCHVVNFVFTPTQ